jgi:hypothetical protein
MLGDTGSRIAKQSGQIQEADAMHLYLNCDDC